MMSGISAAFAQFAGPVPGDELGLPGDVNDPRASILNIVRYILTFLALAAVIVIIIAGIRLILSQGEEEPKEKAKKTIFYAIIGLLVVLFSRIIVALITEELPGRI